MSEVANTGYYLNLNGNNVLKQISTDYVNTGHIDTGYMALTNHYVVGEGCYSGVIGRMWNGEILQCVGNKWEKIAGRVTAKGFTTYIADSTTAYHSYCAISYVRNMEDDHFCEVVNTGSLVSGKSRFLVRKKKSSTGCSAICVDL